MIKKYSFVSDENRVFDLYNRVVGDTWPIGKEQFYDTLVHTPPPQAVASFLSVSQGKINGFISTQIIDKKGSIVLLLFEPGHEYIGQKLLQKALEHFQKKQVTSIQLGAGGYTYFWPGIPTNIPHLISFFEKQGWQFTESSVDMIRDIGNYTTPKEIHERMVSADITLQFLEEKDSDSLLRFEHHHFPQWEQYFSEAVSKGKFNNILIAKTRNEEIVSSVLVSKQDVLWTKLLGENVGTIGALGVAEQMRNKGIGLALVARATEVLKERHVKTCYVGWTWLTDWYGKLGYTVWREYQMSWKDI